jgi:hypothetical protein
MHRIAELLPSSFLFLIASALALGLAGCTTHAEERRLQAIATFEDNLRAHWIVEDEVLGYRDIYVEDTAALEGLSGAELGRFLELYRDGVRLIPVFSFRHEGRVVDILQGYRGRGQYVDNSDLYQTIETPFRDHREYQRIYREHHAFVFIDDRLAFVLDQSQIPDVDRIAIEAWTEGAAPYLNGFAELMTRLQALQLDGSVRFARLVSPPDTAFTQRRSSSVNPVIQSAPETSRVAFSWPQGWLARPMGGHMLELEAINRLSTYTGDLRTLRAGDPLPEWPHYYERLPGRHELVQRFPVSEGYELIGIKVTPSHECSPYGGGCGYIGERRYWIGAREGVVAWIDTDLPPIRDNRLREWNVRDRVCAFLQASQQPRQRYCR